MQRILLATALAVAVLAWSRGAAAEEVRVVTWNVRDVFTVSDATSRISDFQQAAAALEPDILLIQEITSHQIALAIRNAMGLRVRPESLAASPSCCQPA